MFRRMTSDKKLTIDNQVHVQGADRDIITNRHVDSCLGEIMEINEHFPGFFGSIRTSHQHRVSRFHSKFIRTTYM